ncbi:hypothetical protein PR048_007052 [Dryococelus australis]|uniref:Uncharacterized protein n=1 Tax=Dryococelus australis TaxID=614101 RepID=A0ABQ9ICM3_9NEOP|nr:hypothetical protein PR048_007052 [Dryococelus australis]
MKGILDRYHIVLQTLKELVTEENQQLNSSDLPTVFESGTTLLRLLLGQKVITTCELLNKSFQGRQQAVSGLMKAADVTTAAIEGLRKYEVFDMILKEANKKVAEYNLQCILIRSSKTPPSQYTGSAESFAADRVCQHYRKEYYAIINAALQDLK